MPFVSKRANLLERSVQGLPSADPEVARLVATASRIPVLTSPACGPRDDFVRTLGLQLHAEALTMTARQVRSPSTPAVRRSAAKPVILVIGKGMRVLAGVTASLLLIGAVLGVTSRSALPGGLLYPVKQVLDSAAVHLAGSDFDRGVTLLSQAQTDIGDARALVDRDKGLTDPASVNQALLSATDAISTGQAALLGEFDRSPNTAALLAVQDFTVRALPQLIALRPMVPAASRPDVDALISQLHQSRLELAQEIALCGQRCASLGSLRLGSPQSSTPFTGLPFMLPEAGLPTGGIPAAGLKPAITGPGAVGVAPGAPPLPNTGAGAGVPILPPVTAWPRIVTPSPLATPSLLRLPPLPVLPPLTVTPVLPSVPTGLPGLP